MESKAVNDKLRGKSGRDLRILDGGKKQGGTVKRGAGGDLGPHKRRQFVPAKELVEAFADVPSIDYERLRADLDAIADPSPRDWYDWQARNGRHVRRGGLEQRPVPST